MRDDGGGGDLALVLPAVRPGSRPEHDQEVTSHHGQDQDSGTSPEHQAPVRAVLGVTGLVPQV